MASDDLRLLNMDDVCELLGVKKRWLYYQVESKAIKSVKLNSHIRFRRSDVEEYINAHAT